MKRTERTYIFVEDNNYSKAKATVYIGLTQYFTTNLINTEVDCLESMLEHLQGDESLIHVIYYKHATAQLTDDTNEIETLITTQLTAIDYLYDFKIILPFPSEDWPEESDNISYYIDVFISKKLRQNTLSKDNC